ncbi:MAG: hypothetical protein R2854_16565 [Caldilineaceae bacterium]
MARSQRGCLQADAADAALRRGSSSSARRMLGDLFHAVPPQRPSTCTQCRHVVRSIQRTFSRDMEAVDRQELTPT